MNCCCISFKCYETYPDGKNFSRQVFEAQPGELVTFKNEDKPSSGGCWLSIQAHPFIGHGAPGLEGSIYFSAGGLAQYTVNGPSSGSGGLAYELTLSVTSVRQQAHSRDGGPRNPPTTTGTIRVGGKNDSGP